MIILMLFSAVLNAFVYYDIKSDVDVKSSVISSTVSVNLGDKKERLEFYLNNNLEIFMRRFIEIILILLIFIPLYSFGFEKPEIIVPVS
ncbi:MAG: hypothetical protein N2Z60_09040, partial [Elusimicrobiales bacterium]|nr:hypothetical protein [Elusimicrobiales bacterium]